MQCNAMQCNAMQYNVMRRNTIQRNVMHSKAKQMKHNQCNAIQCYSVVCMWTRRRSNYCNLSVCFSCACVFAVSFMRGSLQGSAGSVPCAPVGSIPTTRRPPRRSPCVRKKTMLYLIGCQPFSFCSPLRATLHDLYNIQHFSHPLC